MSLHLLTRYGLPRGDIGGGIVQVLEVAAASSVATVPIPIPDQAEVGDQVLAFFRTGGTNPAVSGPSGWDVIASVTNAGASRVWGRVIDGTEGATADVTLSSGRWWALVVVLIRGATGTPEAASFTLTEDPPEVAPSWGAVPTLYFAMCGWRIGSGSVTAIPSGYEFAGVAQTGGSDTNHAAVAVVSRVASVAEEDPSTFDSSGLGSPRATTIAVRLA